MRRIVNRPAFPTPYSDVNVVLLGFAKRIQTILGDQLIGLYLYGSLALGDFDPQSSDIDYIAVTQSELPAGQIDRLRTMHLEFDRSSSCLAGRVEAAYIPLSTLKRDQPPAGSYPQVEKGLELFLAPLEAGWAFQRYTLRERSVVVCGPSPEGFTDPVDLDEMRRAALTILDRWQEQARRDADWIAWVRHRSAQAFVVLTICRLRYSLASGDVASKPAAARWAQANLGRRWGTLIAEALARQNDEQEISNGELDATLDFIDDGVKMIQGEDVIGS